MKRKTARSPLTRRRFLVEGLEPRCMLAGNVNVFVSGGTLFVQGDGGDNAVLIQQEGNGVYSVTGLDFSDLSNVDSEVFDSGPTTINGEDLDGDSFVVSGVTNDINVNLGAGDDGLGIGNNLDNLSSLSEECFGVSFLPPDEEISLQALETTLLVPRNLFINLGDGNDFTAIDANVGTLNSNGTTKKGGVANINAGGGDNAVAFGTEGGDFVADDLLISAGGGSDDVCVFGTGVRDLLSVLIGDGNQQEVRLGGVGAGHAQILTGNGSDDVNVSGLGLDREIVVNTGAGDDFVSMNEFSAGNGDGPSGKANKLGYVTVVTGDGDDQVDISGFNVDGMTVDTGAGDDGQNIPEGDAIALQIASGVSVSGGFVTNALVLVTGSGNDFATVNNITAHDIVVDTGLGDDGTEEFPISIYNVTVKGNVTLATGLGNDFAYMHSGDGQASNIKGTVTVDMSSDNDNLEIVDQSIGKDLNVFLGNGTNNAGIGGGVGEAVGVAEGRLSIGRNLNIYGGPNTDNVGLFNLSVHSDLFADLGSGDDNLFAGGNEVAIIAIGRNATLLGGAGSDNMTINFANIGGNALIDAGSGGDTVSIDFCNIAKISTILMGAGDDTLHLFNSTAKKLIARGGPGTDTFDNDLGITKNGRNSNGSIDVQEFEIFEDLD
jgi:hypothetical protein